MITFDDSRPNSPGCNADGHASAASLHAACSSRYIDSGARHRFSTNITRALHARLLQRLSILKQRHPSLILIHAPNEVIMPAPTRHGFPMAICTNNGRYSVRLGEWWDDFARAEEAVELIDDAMCGYIRLKVIVDDTARLSTLERQLPDGIWLEQPRTVAGETRSTTDTPYAVYRHNDFTNLGWP